MVGHPSKNAVPISGGGITEQGEQCPEQPVGGQCPGVFTAELISAKLLFN